MTSQLEQYLLEESLINASSTHSNLTKKHSSRFQYVIESIFHISKRLVSIWSKIVVVTIYFVQLFVCRTSFNWFPKPALHDILLFLSISYISLVIISNDIPPTLYLLHPLHYCLKWYLFTALCSVILLSVSLIRLDKILLKCSCQFPLWISIVKRLQQHSLAKGLTPSLLTLQQMMIREQEDDGLQAKHNPLFYQSCQELKYGMFSYLQRVVKVCLLDYEMQQQPDSSDEAVITIQQLQTLYHHIVHEYLPQRLFSLYLPFYANDDASSSFFTSFLSLATAVIAAFTVTWEIGTHMQDILTKCISISSYHSKSTLGYDDTSSSSSPFPLLHRLQQMRKKQERLLRSLQRCEEFLYSSLQQFPSSSSMQSDDRRGSSASERLLALLLDSSSNDHSTSLDGLTAEELQALLFSKYSSDNDLSQLLSSLLSLQQQQSHREQAGVATVDDQHPAGRSVNVCLSDLVDVRDMQNEEDDDEHGTGPQSNTGSSRWDDDQCKEEEVLQGTVFKDISLFRNRDGEYDQQSSAAAQAEGRQRQQTLMIEMKAKLYMQQRLIEQRPQRVIDFDKAMLNGESYSNTRTVSTAVSKEQAEAALPANEEVAISVIPLAVRHDILSALGKNPVFQISYNRKDGTLGDDDSENDEE